jgi:hypothetical protein
MAFSIGKLAAPVGDNLFYNPSFCRYLETYLPFLRSHPKTVQITIDPHDVYKYEGDFYGLLSKNGIAHENHWLVMRVNDIKSPAAVPLELGMLWIPDLNLVSRIRQLYNTKSKKVATTA